MSHQQGPTLDCSCALVSNKITSATPKIQQYVFFSIANALINDSLFLLQYTVDHVGLAHEKNKTAGRKEGVHHMG